MRDRKLKVEEMPLDVQNKILEWNSQGMPIITIKDNLKKDYDEDISDKSLRRFTTKYTEARVSKEIKSNLDTSFERAIKNMNNLHGLNQEAIMKLQRNDDDLHSREWFANLRCVGLNTLDCFKALYQVQGQQVSEEKKEDIGDQMEQIAEAISKEKKKREALLVSNPSL